MLIGGQEPIVLSRLQSENGALPEFISATLLPGRGMNVFQITAFIPGIGKTELLASPPLQQAATQLSGTGPDKNGDMSFRMGGAFLLPYPNRVRGKFDPQTQTIRTEWEGHPLTLPANENADAPGLEPVAMHGLILNKAADSVETNTMPDGGVATAIYNVGDFGGHWLSHTQVTITIVLSGRAFDCIVTAKNVGDRPEPMAIGWHPYFAIPSGQRDQAMLRIPSSTRVEVNNYKEVFPTGRLLQVEGTPYDFTARGGRPLGNTYLDDDYVDLKSGLLDDGPVVELRDPASNFGLRVMALSSQIRSLQVFSPLEKKFVAIEPQFNYADPFGKEWHGQNTGMVTLDPGKSVTWKVRVELFSIHPLGDQKPDSHPLIPGQTTGSVP